EPGEDYKPALEGAGGNEGGKTDDIKEASSTAETTDKPETKVPSQEAAEGGIDPESVGAAVIRMPLLSDTMTEGVIAEWHKKVGDQIKSDDILADVETDKATMEVTAYAEGTLLYVGLEKG